MRTSAEIEQILKKLKPLLLKRYYVEKIGYFGSYSRNEQKPNSDIDILVSFAKPLGWDFFDLQELLEKELDLKVDLISDKAIKKQLKQYILNSVRYV